NPMKPARRPRRCALLATLLCSIGVSGAAAAADLRLLSPPNPYGPAGARDPECGTMKYFGEGLRAGFDGLFDAVDLGLDVVVPDVGWRRAAGGSGLVLSWPLAASFGPATARSVRRY